VSTLYDPAWSAAAPRPAVRAERLFFPAMGIAVALLVFAGFARTYYLSHWVSQPARAPEFTPLLQVHAALFTAWILLGAVQPWLIARGRIALHIRFGIAGAGLAFLVWLFGNVASAQAMNVGYKGVGDPHAFYAVTFFSMQAFGIIVALGILKRREAETHKRLMLLSSAAILEAAIGRLPLDIVVQAAPLSFYLGADLLIVAGIVFDRTVRGRVHPVWIWGGGALVLSQALRVAIMSSEPWLAFARSVASLA
jgi:uncharacterized membrane protein YozB (DUF420 family)